MSKYKYFRDDAEVDAALADFETRVNELSKEKQATAAKKRNKYAPNKGGVDNGVDDGVDNGEVVK